MLKQPGLTRVISLTAYHSLDLAVGRAVSIEKDSWDAAHAERIEAACNPAASATLAAVVMQEGLAHLCLVGGATTTVRARIEASMPRKAGPAAAGYDKALKKFFDNLLAAVLRHVDFAVVRVLLIAGPGFTKDAFVAHMFAEAQRRELKSLLEAKPKVITAHASSGYKHALAEALASPALAARVADTAAAAEVAALDAFYAMMSADPSRAFYGPGHVRAAAELGAVQTLLLSDELYRTADAAERAAWVDLVAAVRAAGGDAHVFSAGHLSGQRLTQARLFMRVCLLLANPFLMRSATRSCRAWLLFCASRCRSWRTRSCERCAQAVPVQPVLSSSCDQSCAVRMFLCSVLLVGPVGEFHAARRAVRVARADEQAAPSAARCSPAARHTPPAARRRPQRHELAGVPRVSLPAIPFEQNERVPFSFER
jgi:protein pelota